MKGENTRTRTALEIAAPDLLAACKAALAQYITPSGTLVLGSPIGLVDSLRAAIAKAEGGAA